MKIEKQEADYNMFDWWKKVVVENYANFDGRARRSEYWYFTLVNLIAVFGYAMIMGVAASALGGDSMFVILIIPLILGVFAILIPGIAVAVRRLHDTGKSGWWYLIGVIPVVSYIGGFVLLIFYCIEGDRGKNEHGPDPKNRHDDEWNQPYRE